MQKAVPPGVSDVVSCFASVGVDRTEFARAARSDDRWQGCVRGGVEGCTGIRRPTVLSRLGRGYGGGWSCSSNRRPPVDGADRGGL